MHGLDHPVSEHPAANKNRVSDHRSAEYPARANHRGDSGQHLGAGAIPQKRSQRFPEKIRRRNSSEYHE